MNPPPSRLTERQAVEDDHAKRIQEIATDLTDPNDDKAVAEVRRRLALARKVRAVMIGIIDEGDPK